MNNNTKIPDAQYILRLFVIRIFGETHREETLKYTIVIKHKPFSKLSIWSLVKLVLFLCSFLFSLSLSCESSSADELCSELPSDVLSGANSAAETRIRNSAINRYTLHMGIIQNNSRPTSLITILYYKSALSSGGECCARILQYTHMLRIFTPTILISVGCCVQLLRNTRICRSYFIQTRIRNTVISMTR